MSSRCLVFLVLALLVTSNAFADKCVPRSFSGGSHMQAMTCFKDQCRSMNKVSQKAPATLRSFSGGSASSVH